MMAWTKDRVLALRADLWRERTGLDARYRELSDVLAPRWTRFEASERNRGRRAPAIVNSVPRYAVRTLQSGLHAGLTSPARQWFRLTTPDPDLADRPGVAEWLYRVTQRMARVFARTNLYECLSVVYGHLGVFGTAAMSVLPDSRDLFRCHTYPIGSYALGLDARGLVTTFVRDYELTARQVVEAFGWRGPGHAADDIDWSRISPEVREAWTGRHYETPVRLTWLVTPNTEADPRQPFARHKPWISLHIEPGGAGDRILRESGFDTFPVLCPRWETTGEDAYGTDCPGMMALGDVQALQVLERKAAQALAKQIDPPLKGTPALKRRKTSLLPGDVTYLDEPERGLLPIHEVRVDLSAVEAKIARHEQRIKRAFFEDLFLMLATSDGLPGAQPITAREVAERHEEKLLALGPVLESTSDELLDPLIDRVYQLMDDAGLVPAAPPELEDVALRVEYVSILTDAQKLVGVVGADRFLGTVAQLGSAYPEALDKIDVQRVVDSYADMLGVDPRYVRSTEAAQAIARARQQAQAAALQAQQTAVLAKAARDAANAPMGQNSALDAITGGAVAPAGVVPTTPALPA